MQAIEMMVFFIASVIIASLILLFIGSINPDELYGTIEDLVFPQQIDVNTMTTTTKLGFAGKIGACWEQCAFGGKNLNCGTFYITDEVLAEEENSLDSESLQAIFEKYNYCTNCDILIESGKIDLPAVVGLECKNGQIVVES